MTTSRKRYDDDDDDDDNDDDYENIDEAKLIYLDDVWSVRARDKPATNARTEVDVEVANRVTEKKEEEEEVRGGGGKEVEGGESFGQQGRK
ncbi:hypothetical protein M0802_010353 [Mischocyttarus mexicanus]|nr:hypothetical protein M0802_010353 [Mischocyttarus mexicanus]